MMEIMASLIKEIRSEREKAEAETKAIQAETEAIRARTKAMRNKQMEANLNACQKETVACQEMTEAIPVTMEACQDIMEPSPEEMESGMERREVPTEMAAVNSLGAMKKQHRGRRVTAGQRGEPKELSRGDCGSQRKLAAACRKVSRHAAVAWRKRNLSRNIRTQRNHGPRKELAAAVGKTTRCARVAQLKVPRPQGHSNEGQSVAQGRNNQNMNKFARGTRKEITNIKRSWKFLDCNNGIRNRDFGKQLRLGSRCTLKKDLYEMVGVKIAKQLAGSYVALRRVKDWTMWRGRPPPKRKKSRKHGSSGHR